ncbi:MAG: prolyl oligopeptidase family serine peptidase [Phycisphaerae bacterium]|nr:prolyl oligopeptidase family serine peptidase [Phycisphaerae bacterium]
MVLQLRIVVSVLMALYAAHATAAKPRTAESAEPIVLKEGLAIGPVGRYSRSPIVVDALQTLIASGEWKPPVAGDQVAVPGRDPEVWTEIKADEDGWFRDQRLGGGYAAIPVVTEGKRIALLEAAGHGMVYVNGEPRPGDPYRNGNVRLPIMLRRGQNWLVFQCGRGEFHAQLTTPAGPLMLDTADATVPDLRVGTEVDALGAVMVINATADWQKDLAIETAGEALTTQRTPLPPIPPLTVREVPFELRGTAPAEKGACKFELLLLNGEQVAHSVDTEAPIRDKHEDYRVTFRSEIDGSVQYYAVKPARPLSGDSRAPALFLSLHGAGVEALGQVNAYASKTWGHIVAPTNRRPFGFDWEDWGRLDALEVLAHTRHMLNTDPSRTYLTGHSMGGHGVWTVGALFPDRFAAIGPSAGWISFFSYAGAEEVEGESSISDILRRAARASDTLTFINNYAQEGVYILHGADDDNVPVGQAREMREKLGEFHYDLQYHEEPGKKHWWDVSDAEGTDCVDWAPMFDMFARRRIPADYELREVEFTTINPEISATCHWATIWAQQRPYMPSTVKLRCDPWKRRFTGTTDNVATLMLSLDHMMPDQPVSVTLDEQTLDALEWPACDGCLWLARDGDTWKRVTRPDAAHKSPRRYGPFKHAFNHRFVFVVGTQGTAEENAWALAKARYDAESFWYRGNGSIDTVLDSDFRPEAYVDRSVILYGNADSNGAWSRLLGDCPVQVKGGSIRVGTREFTDDNLAALFVYPRADSDVACVGAVGGSGITGMRLATRLPYFVSGVAYPDCVVLDPAMLAGQPGGVRAAGFFGVDWTVETGDFAWSDEAQ